MGSDIITEVYMLIKNNSGISTDEICTKLDFDRKSIDACLIDLKERSIIENVIPQKRDRWKKSENFDDRIIEYTEEGCIFIDRK